MADADQQPDSQEEAPQGGGASQEQEKAVEKEKPVTYTQADVERMIRDRLGQERKKYADYDDLKAKAQGQATAEERIANLERDLETTRTEAMRRRIQAAHSISDEDAELFLTAGDEDTLTAQAKALVARDAERTRKSSHIPSGERTAKPPAADEKQTFANRLTGHSS